MDGMSKLAVIDIGGTHARFALAEVRGGKVSSLGEAATFRTGDFADLGSAWREFGKRSGELPDAVSIAFAGPVGGEELRLTNNEWVIRPADLPMELKVERWRIVNDFGAVAHAVAQLDGRHFDHVAGPEQDVPQQGSIAIVGPGTGLGVAQLIRTDSDYRVLETEGGHIAFAPLDELDDLILSDLRERHGRVSVERIVSGSGLTIIHRFLCAREGIEAPARDEKELWSRALSGADELAQSALDRFCHLLGAVAGDLALAQGASAVVLAGGLGQRLRDHLAGSSFPRGFTAKGRFSEHMARIPVKLVTHDQPGLFGAAAAFAADFAS